MSKVFFTSDLHLGHKAIFKYRDGFIDSAHHDETVFMEIEKLEKNDILYVLGDFIFDCDQYNDYIKRLVDMPCRFKVVLGNHDTMKILETKKFEILPGLGEYRHMWLSHCPIHPDELRSRVLNIHGHMHQTNLLDRRYFNVNFDCWDYKFVPLQKIFDRKSLILNGSGV